MSEDFCEAKCENCGWTGSSEFLGVTYNFDDADCYCRCCRSSNVDVCEPPEGESNFSLEHSIKETKRCKRNLMFDASQKINMIDNHYGRITLRRRLYAAFYIFINLKSYRRAIDNLYTVADIEIPTKGEA